MAEKRKMKKRKEDISPEQEQPEKPTKDEYAVAKWLRNNIPYKTTKFSHFTVQFFTASKAVDALMESQWAKPDKKGGDPMFTSRADVVDFLDIMLRHKFFHRARKVVVPEEELKLKKKKEKRQDGDESERKKEKETEKRILDDADSSHPEGSKDDKPAHEGKERKKRKIRLEMHMEQVFVDGTDAYVWIYDPIPFYYWVFGTLVVLGAIGICVFPLWPSSVRKGVYYLSVAAAGFLLLILVLAVFRVVLFCFIWVITLKKHHFWLLPNLTQDVGFLPSFWPLYHYEYRGDESSSSKDSKKKRKKDKDSDAEEDDKHVQSKPLDEPAVDEEQGNGAQESCIERRSSDGGTKDTESESENSQKSATGRDFEMIEKEDVEDSAS